MSWISLTARLPHDTPGDVPTPVLVRSEHVSAIGRLASPPGAVLMLTSGREIDVNEDGATVQLLIIAAEP